MKALKALLGLAVTTALVAQSPVDVNLVANNAGAAGGQVFFDLQVNTTITLQALDVKLNSLAGTAGTIEVRIRNGSYLGQELTAAAWPATADATGAVTTVGPGVFSPVCLSTPITLNPGLTGVCLRFVGVGAQYTNGTGTVIPGGGGANQTFATSEVTLLAGAAQNAPWVGSFQPRVFNGQLHYIVGAAGQPCSTAPASNEDYGEGCYRYVGTWWDGFNPAVAAATATQEAATNLSNRSISWLPSGPGYLVLPGLTGVSLVPPTGGAVTLAGFVPTLDDGDTTVNLTTPFPFGGGSLTSLVVHTNGMVSTGSNEAFFNLNGFFSYQPTVQRWADTPNQVWGCWHDFNPAELNSGQIKFEEIAGVAYFTWDNVESYPGSATVANPNPSTFQLQFDCNTGQVNMVFGTVNPAGVGNNVSDLYLVGSSQSGPGGVHPETDVTTFTSINLDGVLDRLPLAVTASTRPVLGANVRFTTTNETPSATPFGVTFISLSDLPPFSPIGLDLGIIGAPGCVANIDPNLAPIQAVITTLTPNGMVATLPIPVIPTAVGLVWYVQSVWLDPAVNAFGLLTSNGIKQTLGTW